MIYCIYIIKVLHTCIQGDTVMASKVPIRLRDYKVRKPLDEQTSSDKYNTLQCIINVSTDLADFLNVSAYVPPPNAPKPRPNPVNVTTYDAYSTGTYHGKTVFIITDGEGGDTYKKMYQMQLPNAYPIQFLKEFLEDRQSNTGNAIKYVKIRNGRRYPVKPSAPPAP